jgi:hypothetical protein
MLRTFCLRLSADAVAGQAGKQILSGRDVGRASDVLNALPRRSHQFDKTA